jgi:hypothetical protein
LPDEYEVPGAREELQGVPLHEAARKQLAHVLLVRPLVVTQPMRRPQARRRARLPLAIAMGRLVIAERLPDSP